jgi:hypothetical protein
MPTILLPRINLDATGRALIEHTKGDIAGAYWYYRDQLNPGEEVCVRVKEHPVYGTEITSEEGAVEQTYLLYDWSYFLEFCDAMNRHKILLHRDDTFWAVPDPRPHGHK